MEKILEEFNKLDLDDKKQYINDILPNFKTKRSAEFRDKFDKKYKQIIEKTPLVFKAGEDKSSIIDGIISLLSDKLSKDTTTTTFRKSSSPKVPLDSDIVLLDNPLHKIKSDEELKKDDEEANALKEDNILQLQLDLDSIIYTKLSPELKKKQLLATSSRLKDLIEAHKITINRDEYIEDLKKKLPKKNGTENTGLFELFTNLIDEYFTSQNTILSFKPEKINGGLSFRHIDSKEDQMKYKSELDQAKKIKDILNKIQIEKEKQKNIQIKIDNKIKAINDANQKNIHLGDRIQCSLKLTMRELKEPGVVKDINYIPGKISGYTVELLINNVYGTVDKRNLSSCILLTPAIEEDEKKKQALIDEKTDFLSKQIASQYGFKIGDPVDCTLNDGKNISGIAKKFKFNILERKTYILVKEKNKDENKELTQVDVKYCTNEYNHTLKNINKLKEREYMKKQFKKLQEIIKKINKLNPSDENYEFIIKNLTNEYDLIESQINYTLQTISDESSKCSESDEDCKSKSSPKENPEQRLNDTEDIRLEDIRKKRVALLQLLQKIKPDDYLKLNTILKRSSYPTKKLSLDAPNVGVSIGGHNQNKYTAQLKNKFIKLKNGKLPILNTVKGGYNTYGLTQKYIQRAGYSTSDSINTEENINDIINNSNNLLSIMDKTL